MSMLARFEEFIRERQYLHNVSPRTIEWYRNSLRWLPCESPSQSQLTAVVVAMREAGLKPSGCNCLGRAINAYLHWAHVPDGKCSVGCKHPKIARLKEPALVLPTYTEHQIRRIIAWKPRVRFKKLLRLLVLFLLDTGCRISEAINVRVRDVDLDNLLVTLDGKGSKQRIVPFSFELRAMMFRHVREGKLGPDALLFGTRTGTRLGRNNVLRAMKALCRDLGFEPPARTVHATRHTFAVNYLRRGGSEFRLQKVLGHSSLEMTRRYANLVTADLQAVHEKVSLLSTS